MFGIIKHHHQIFAAKQVIDMRIAEKKHPEDWRGLEVWPSVVLEGSYKEFFVAFYPDFSEGGFTAHIREAVSLALCEENGLVDHR